MNELKLIKSIRNKQISSYRTLIDMYIKDVQAIVISLCNGYLCKEEMESICYKTFENIWNSKEKLVLNGKLRSYIFKIVREEVLKKRKSKLYNKCIENEIAEKIEFKKENYDIKLIDDDFEDYLEELGHIDKEILIRRYFYYQSEEEISKILKCHIDEINESIFRSESIFISFFNNKERANEIKLENLISNISIKNLDDIEFYMNDVELDEKKIRIKALEVTKEVEEEIKKRENHRKLKNFYERNISVENIKKEEKKIRNKHSIVSIFIIILIIKIVTFNYSEPEVSEYMYPSKIDKKMENSNKYVYSKQGINLSVESIDLEEKQGFIRFNLTKEDGGFFEENTKLKEVKTNSNNTKCEVKSELVENNKKIVCSVKLDKEEAIMEDEINITAYNLIKEIEDKKELDIDLYNVYSNKYINNNRENNLGIDVNSVKYINNDLYIQAKNNLSMSSVEKYMGIEYLINSNTENKMYPKEKVEVINKQGLVESVQYIFDINSIEELKYLKPVVNYIKEETVLNEEWVVNIDLNRGKDSTMIEVQENINYENQESLIMKIKVEEINIALERVRLKGAYFENISLGKLLEAGNENPYLIYKNGEKLNLNRTNTEYNKCGEFIYDFTSKEDIDAKNVKRVVIGEMNININY
ncbi:DNA-directed RNA polymerase specialized sigma subunit, sigma24 family [Clostridium collagenovorans DSM 3089]|uniref:DNA-directed RNA polymerase specialized sigma subunit, sigma24 family n=1 Tax=Clostridium collagenovorans DSM 3089 TaxID=1121306 RepID=A0A1M5VI22_9CLOT|nr:sigma-70 family RNA polymerase sigma factor [Clostridium collagenovorans]SHH74553.1 DNA-directed RNA polymerase specialized sigma subunit, sigma24 family [Clostridium collagenovorans DSM 3089]